MTLDQMHALVKIVQSGSFTRAAELLGTQRSHLSRTLTQLEAELAVRLIERSTRSIRVTEIGKEVFERALGILNAVDDVQRVVVSTRSEPRGKLRITCGVEFGQIAVNAWVSEFMATHPMVAIDLDYSSHIVDLVHEGFDIAIRVGALQESRLAARALGQIEYGLFACPRYLARYGTPETVDALKQHQLLMFVGGSHAGSLRLQRADETIKIDTAPRLRVNNSFALRDALLRSLGIGQLPLMIAAALVRSGRLVSVLPGWSRAPVPVHAVFPSNRYLTPKVRAFIDLAVARFPAPDSYSDLGMPRCVTSDSPKMKHSADTARKTANTEKRK
jgi:LysR family transcriptional regulator, regulator for bpeEF and oprC